VAIGEAIRETLSAYEVEDACVRLGLPSAAAHDDDPMNSKAWYVRRRLALLPLWRVVAIGHEVADAYGRDDVAEILAGFGAQGYRCPGARRERMIASYTTWPKPRLRTPLTSSMLEAVYCLEIRESGGARRPARASGRGR
jgi:hypothetical protein